MWHMSIIHTPSYRILHGGIKQHDDHSKETMDRLGVPQKLEHVRDKDYHMLKEDIPYCRTGLTKFAVVQFTVHLGVHIIGDGILRCKILQGLSPTYIDNRICYVSLMIQLGEKNFNL